MKQQVNIGIIGFGTVAGGVYKILHTLAAQIREKSGADIVIKRIVTKDVEKVGDIKYDPKLISKNINDILNDPSIDIVVELIGGYEPARTFILDALKRGKHVVTANKAVLAKYWDEVQESARKHHALLYFEASVGGGIPIIQGLNEGLAANRIDAMYGILNGTTNYILTNMRKAGLDFFHALKLAQQKGFAEADPTFDIKGIDTAHKLAVLASIAYQAPVSVDNIFCEGIDAVEREDIVVAEEEFDCVVKLLAITKRTGNKIELRVHPTLIPKTHLLAAVDDEYNAIYVDGSAVGKIMFYGKGAGQLPAASAVVSDIMYIARKVVDGTAGTTPLVTYDRSKKLNVCSHDDIVSKYYIRFSVVDKPGVLSKISGVLGKYHVSIASCFQKGASAKAVPIVMLTHKAQEKNVQKALRTIDALAITKAKSVVLRVEDEI